MIEGEKVAYAGDTDPFNRVGASGKVIAISGSAAHVQWTAGPKMGQIDLVEQHELVPDRGAPVTASAGLETFDAALGIASEEEHAPRLSVQAIYDEVGEEGLLNVLSEAGHLSMVAEYAEEVLDHLVARVRQTPALEAVLSQLEGDEQESLLERIAVIALNDRLKEN